MVILQLDRTALPRQRMLSFALAFGVLLAVVRVVTLRADEPPYFVIRDARIVPVSGPVIEKGTVVMAKGLIVAVG